MPPRITLIAPHRLAFRPRFARPQRTLATTPSRYAQDDPSKGSIHSNPGAETGGPNESGIPHVSEEQAAIDKIMGEVPPQTDEQGTPIQEILQRDKEAQKNAPEVLKNGDKKPNDGQKRSYSTSARRLDTTLQSSSGADAPLPESMLVPQNGSAPVQFEETRALGLEYPDAGLGHKFPLPDPDAWKVTDHLRRRYDPVVDQFTKMIMRDGKLARAQKARSLLSSRLLLTNSQNMAAILTALRTAPSPQPNATRPLLSDSSIATSRTTAPAVSRTALPLSPIQYLTSVIDSVAPLVKIRQQRGVLGGGQSLPIPVPLRIKQRRRTAIKWILESSEKRGDVAMADRISREIIAVASGGSGVWEKRAQLHRMAITARSNVRSSLRGRKR